MRFCFSKFFIKDTLCMLFYCPKTVTFTEQLLFRKRNVQLKITCLWIKMMFIYTQFILNKSYVFALTKIKKKVVWYVTSL